MKGRLLFAIVLGGVIVLNVVALNKGKGRTRWQDLAMHRERAVWSRYLPAFRAFLNHQNQFSATPHYRFAFSADRAQQYMPFEGVLVDTTYVNSQSVPRFAGRFKGNFYWDSWTTEPTSADFRLNLDAALVARSGAIETELGSLIKESMGHESHRSEIGAVRWLSRRREDGGLEVTLRFAYPSPWIPSVMKTDRGGQDRFDFVDVHTAIRFLYREVLADRYLPIYFDPPSPTVPDQPSQYGSLNGFAMPKEGTLQRVTLASHPDGTQILLQLGHPTAKVLDIQLKPSFDERVPGKEASSTVSDGVTLWRDVYGPNSLMIRASPDRFDKVRWAPPAKDR